jgi:hypothetical protein
LIAAGATAQPNPASPLVFFTDLTTRFLKAELNLDLNRIQIWPTNQYTPAVHRLLQVSANLLDATTNRFNGEYPYLPSVFRPVFTNDGNVVFICGYVEEPGNAFTNHWRDLTVPSERAALQGDDYVSGIPLVIGAKTGFPNFNR